MKKFIKPLLVFIASFSLISCINNKENSEGPIEPLGAAKINYYSDKSVSNLVIPPDLTSPNYDSALRLERGIEQEFINFENDTDNLVASSVLTTPPNIEIKRQGNQRWLLVDLEPNKLWQTSRDFLKSQGFIIEKADRAVGVLETNYLESHVDVPNSALGPLRSLFARAINTRYALPVLDKYRIRIEPTENPNQSEVFLSLHSIAEVVIEVESNLGPKQTRFQENENIKEYETEMLYRLMIYLGQSSDESLDKIQNTLPEKEFRVTKVDGQNGFAKLNFGTNQAQTWHHLNWALDKLNVTVEDRDEMAASIFITGGESQKEEKFLSRFLRAEVNQNAFRLLLKSIGNESTDVIFSNIAGGRYNEAFSHQFLTDVQALF